MRTPFTSLESRVILSNIALVVMEVVMVEELEMVEVVFMMIDDYLVQTGVPSSGAAWSALRICYCGTE